MQSPRLLHCLRALQPPARIFFELSKKSLPACSFIVFPLVFFTSTALAQTPASQLTPRDLRPEVETKAPSLERKLTLPSKPKEIDDATASLEVTVGEVLVEGGFSELTEVTARLVEPFKGRQSSVEELHALARALEAVYSQAGYFLARVTIPPQSMVDNGVFRLLVVDGYLEAVNIDGVPAKLRPILLKKLQPLKDKSQLKVAQIERALILAGRGPGLQLRSTLAPGKSAGSAILVVESAYNLLGGSWSIDNRLSESLGPWQSVLQLQVNQLMGMGEQFYAYVSGHSNPLRMLRSDAKRRVAGGGVSWPIGQDGLQLNLEMTASDTRQPEDFFTPATRSRFDRGSLRLSYPVWLARDGELTVTGIFEASRQYLEIPEFDVELSRDELRVLRLNMSGSQNIATHSRLSFFLQGSKGLNYGARTARDVRASGIPFSRPDAEPDFSKVELSLSWLLMLPHDIKLNSTLRGQKSLGGPLPSAELFNLDGQDALSAFESGSFSDDGGWTLREELGRDFYLGGGSVLLSPYLFVSAGEPSSEIKRVADSMVAGGLGLRGGSGTLRFSVEYGQSRIHPGNDTDHELFASLRMAF